MKACFACVLYKGAQPFLQELIDSLNSQTDQDFEVLFLNDDYDKNELKGLLGKSNLRQYTLVDTRGEFSPAMLRVELLLAAKRMAYELCIIGDADDTFWPNRVGQCKKAYLFDKNAAFYYNNLVKGLKEPVFARLPKRVDNPFPILVNSNFLGMSITAINMSQLSNQWIETLKEGDTHIFDWYLYERMLLDIGYGNLVEDTATVYRIHEGNIAGDQREDESLEDLKREKAVKLEHYGLLSKRYSQYRKYVKCMEGIDIEKISPKKSDFWWSKIEIEV